MENGIARKFRKGGLAAPDLGKQAEAEAESYLRERGWVIFARNWRARGGELDLVAREGDSLVFVEVRRRVAGAWVGAAESVGAHKMRCLLSVSQAYLRRERVNIGFGQWGKEIRFDLLLWEGKNRLVHLRSGFNRDTPYR